LPEGGDRVRASGALRGAMIRTGRIEPFMRSYAKTVRRGAWQFDTEGQGYLFASLPDTKAPGQHQREPVERPKIEPFPMLRLLSVVGNVDVLAAMKGLGETHDEIARRLGLSRPQTTNILNGQFRPSREVVRHVLKLARAA
jgi:hypothetical protein